MVLMVLEDIGLETGLLAFTAFPAAPSLPFSILMNCRKCALVPEQMHKCLELLGGT